MTRCVLIFVACALLVSCQKEPPSQPTPSEAMPVTVKEPQEPQEPQWSIDNGGREVIGKILEALPSAPANTPEIPDGLCAAYAIKPKTGAGRSIAKLGWHVNEEIEKGGVTFVSFFSQSTGGTSGNCDIHDGNVAVFDGDQFIADIYASKKARQPVGTIVDDRNLRIVGSSVVGTPMADVAVDRASKLITIRNIPDVELACNGNVKVPNIYDLQIEEARLKLKKFGWLPSDMSEEADDHGIVKERSDEGHKEYVTCSGTGFGFCNLAYYKDKYGLSVTTYGEESSTVSGYEVHCE